MHRKDLLEKGYKSKRMGTKMEVMAHLKRNKAKYKSYRVSQCPSGSWELYAK